MIIGNLNRKKNINVYKNERKLSENKKIQKKYRKLITNLNDLKEKRKKMSPVTSKTLFLTCGQILLLCVSVKSLQYQTKFIIN